MTRCLLFVVNVDWFFLSHRLPIALEAQRRGYQVHVATGLTDHLAALQSYGLLVHPLDLDRSSANLFNALGTVRQLWRVYSSVRPDIVHLVTIKPVLLGGIVARLAGVPAVVAAVSGLGYVFMAKGFKAGVRRWTVSAMYRMALDHSNLKVIFQNPDDRAAISQFVNLPTSRVETIRGSGVDLDLYRYSKHPNGAPVVLFAARFLVDKGIREFAEAARLLKRRCVSARFCLVGSVDPANPSSLTTAELEQWRQEGLVELWGQRTDMPEVLHAAYAVVLPSYREGLPKILIEAAACGRAVVTTDVPGCRDAIDPGVTGILVPVRDPVALALAIENLIRDPELCRSMGSAGRALAENAFDVRQVVASHMHIYEDLMEKSGRA